VIDAAGLQPGQTVLIAGATGGVGHQAVRLAANAGAQVLATAGTPEEKALVTAVGATRWVDYRSDVAAAVRAAHAGGVDVVIHLAGDPAALFPAVRTGGRFVSTLIDSPDQLPTDDVTVVGIVATPDAATLWRAARHQADGTTRVRIQASYPLVQAATALATFADGTLGKIVITID
jgi:NADPH2:quinone reductase